MSASAYDRVLDALHRAGMKVKVATRGDTARAQCPSHGSRGLSLSVKRGDDRALVKCFAGCEVDEVLLELGLVVKELFDGDLPAGYRPPPRPPRSPFDALTKPGLDHVLARMVTEQKLEADPSLRENARAEWSRVVVIR